jgi:hypothetical protein
VGFSCADHVTPSNPQKLVLTSPTIGGHSVGTVCSRTQATEFVFAGREGLCDGLVPTELNRDEAHHFGILTGAKAENARDGGSGTFPLLAKRHTDFH